MQTEVIIPESVKDTFNEWYIETYFQEHKYRRFELLMAFYDKHFDFKSGVYKAYLRSKGIEAEAIKHTLFTYKAMVKDNESTIPTFTATFDIFNDAEITAINGGFQLRAEQLK